MQSAEEGTFWDGVGEDVAQLVREVPSPSQLLVFIPGIQNKGRGARVRGFSPALKRSDSPSPTTGCVGTVTHGWVGTSRVDFVPFEKPPGEPAPGILIFSEEERRCYRR